MAKDSYIKVNELRSLLRLDAEQVRESEFRMGTTRIGASNDGTHFTTFTLSLDGVWVMGLLWGDVMSVLRAARTNGSRLVLRERDANGNGKMRIIDKTESTTPLSGDLS